MIAAVVQESVHRPAQICRGRQRSIGGAGGRGEAESIKEGKGLPEKGQSLVACSEGRASWVYLMASEGIWSIVVNLVYAVQQPVWIKG